MKREILFRGKTTDTGKWIEGFYFYKYRTQEHGIHCSVSMGVLMDRAFEVIPETVCQFTGLTDKNGVKIWEGDIIAGDSEDVPNRTVEWYNDYLGYFVGLGQGDMQYPLYDVLFPEVIGNIHDNPELTNK